MADSGKLAAGLMVLVIAGLGAGAWFLPRGERASLEAPAAPGPVVEAPAREAAPAARPDLPVVPADADPDLVGRIADLQAQIRDEQAAHLAASTALGERIGALRLEIQALEDEARALEEGRMARLETREGKQEGRCDPAEPESRACKRQAALQGKREEAAAQAGEIASRVETLGDQEQALLLERTEHLRAVDSCAERLRSDPELVVLYAQLAEQAR